MVSDKYRMHRLRAGDEWALGTLAKGNARFGDNEDRPWVAPLSNDEASEFVSDPRTVCVVAIDMGTNNMAGFAYGGVLYRRHTRLRHLCLYEIGVDVDHRDAGVDKLLIAAVGAEARQMGIEQGFAFASTTDHRTKAMYESVGALRSNNDEVLFGLQF
jgi:ribosomal protein S18 acetylase RimI-like enzyme